MPTVQTNGCYVDSEGHTCVIAADSVTEQVHLSKKPGAQLGDLVVYLGKHTPDGFLVDGEFTWYPSVEVLKEAIVCRR